MKAIFVDGSSFFKMGQYIGIQRFNVREVYQLLANEIAPAVSHFQKPIITVTPKCGKALRGKYEQEGFTVLKTDYSPEAEDRAIIDRIEALDPCVTHLVIVTADYDFYEIVQKKILDGIKVWWVGVSQRGSGPPIMSPRLIAGLRNQITFVDLLDYRSRLTEEHVSDQTVKNSSHDDSAISSTMRLEFKHAQPSDRQTILAMVTKILGKSPHLKLKLEG